MTLVACGGNGSSTELSTDEELAAALSTAAEFESYEVSTATGQEIDSVLLGANETTPLDPERPTVVAAVTPDGQHQVIDLAPAFEPLVGPLGELGFEIWVLEDRLVIDTTSFESIAEADPTAQLGPFEPGISFVDLEAVERDAPDLVATLVGTSVPDLATIASALPSALETVEQVGDDPVTFVGTGVYADVLTALGTDVEQTARGAAAGVAVSNATDPVALADFYVELYSATPSDVTVEVDDEGRARSVEVTTDLSGFFSDLVDAPELLPGLDDADIDRLRTEIADDRWTIETLTAFEPAPDLELPPVPETTDDRTQEWIELLAAAAPPTD